ncbi:hypothetical protein M409DRAFT_60080 [Zasmidium cellare ATCC 36951]|uniref:NmrA-like domain-containing protein n=1 Tax=Zasmidium cellare ATCC 36951 TaxID=1080233 RepID=A0A6A6C094_ZASCE|nr:uncharacterized protein M409DRAFT_60080 [Zasmidium cellare ATCC 36951]KAF2160385.1 hypothetical protein M409DRAFT_60080 [Zasmidium cellare ATCC 36951]
MKVQHVAVSGPNGSLGAAVITNLLKAGFEVTVLTRSPEKTAKAFPGVKVAEADYSSVEKLTSTLKSAGKVDAVVCLMNREVHVLPAQLALIDATIAAGIPHYIPSSFGADMRKPKNRHLPPLEPKGDMEDYVVKKANEGALTFTIINQGVLLDWALDRDILLNFDGQPIRLLDHGKGKISATTLDDVGKAVALALSKRDLVINKYCFIHSKATSQLEMLRLLRELRPNDEIKTMNIDTDAMLKESEENFKKGDLSPMAMRGYIVKVSFGDNGEEGNHFDKTDNELLGLPEWSEEQLKEFIKKYIK